VVHACAHSTSPPWRSQCLASALRRPEAPSAPHALRCRIPAGTVRSPRGGIETRGYADRIGPPLRCRESTTLTSPSVLWLERDTRIRVAHRQALAVCLVLGWALLIAARASQPGSFSPFECSTDPWDFLPIRRDTWSRVRWRSSWKRIARTPSTLPDGWIELRYGGARVDVELRTSTFPARAIFPGCLDRRCRCAVDHTDAGATDSDRHAAGPRNRDHDDALR
jgi:hypothetical protein